MTWSFTGGQKPPDRKREPLNCSTDTKRHRSGASKFALPNSDSMRLQQGHNRKSHKRTGTVSIFHLSTISPSITWKTGADRQGDRLRLDR